MQQLYGLVIGVMFIISFVDGLTTFFSYGYVCFALGYILLNGTGLKLFNSRFFSAKNAGSLLLFILIFPIIQYFFTGNYAFKWIINTVGFTIGSISTAAIIRQMTEKSFRSFENYIFIFVYIFTFAYSLKPLMEFGVLEFFQVDRNYLYSSGNGLLPDGFIGKQKTAPLILLFLIITFRLLIKSSSLIAKLLFLLMMIFPLNILFGSRSQISGLVLALILSKSKGKSTTINFYALIVTVFLFLILLFFMTEQFSAMSENDIRVMLFHAGSKTFYQTPILGIGLFSLPQYFEEQNDFLFLKYSHLLPTMLNGNLYRFPTGVESSFLQFSVEIGIAIFPIIFVATKWMLRAHHQASMCMNDFALFSLAYVLSSLTEDNLTQPAFYVIVAILIGSADRIKVAKRHQF